MFLITSVQLIYFGKQIQDIDTQKWVRQVWHNWNIKLLEKYKENTF